MDEIQTLTSQERKLRDMLKDMQKKHGLVAIKLGTEVEASSFEYIAYVNRLAHGIVPIIVKIGGPDARNDIRTLSKMGIGGTIAPMVESIYGLQNYVRAVKEMAGEEIFNLWLKGINVETVNAFKRLSEMLATPESKTINQITIGRDDLSGSIGKHVDDPEVIAMCKEITQKAHDAGLIVSVGGGVTPSNAKMVVEEVKPDKVNTRHMVFSVKDSPNISESVRKGLEFELALLENEVGPLREQLNVVENRIKTLKGRIVK